MRGSISQEKKAGSPRRRKTPRYSIKNKGRVHGTLEKKKKVISIRVDSRAKKFCDWQVIP